MIDVNTISTNSAIRRQILVASFGVTLGLLAFVADVVPESAARLLTPAVSSGFAWGFVALIIGLTGRTLSSATRRSTATLILATITYYCLIMFVSHRWYHNSDGWQISIDGLASIANSVLFWLAGSLCAGIVMGCLAQGIKHQLPQVRTVALAITYGLLSSDASYTYFHTTFIWVGPIDYFIRAQLQSASIQLLLTVTALGLIILLRREKVLWKTFLMVAMASVAASVALWHLVQSLRFLL